MAEAYQAQLISSYSNVTQLVAESNESSERGNANVVNQDVSCKTQSI